MKYAYLRVSSKDQNLSRQVEWVKSVCPDIPEENIFWDKQTGRNTQRPGYQALKGAVARGDEVYVKELDRLGRVKVETKGEVQWFKDAGVRLRIADIPTTLMDFGENDWVLDMINNVLLEVLASVAENEWVTRKRRQEEGIAAAKQNAVRFGRPVKDTVAFQNFLEKTKRGLITVAEACAELGISRATWYNRVREQEVA